MNLRALKHPKPESPVRKSSSKMVIVQQTHEGLRVRKTDDSPVFIKTVFTLVMLTLLGMIAYHTFVSDATVAFYVLGPGVVAILAILGYMHLSHEQLEITLSHLTLVHWPFKPKVFSLGSVRDFQAIHNPASSDDTGWTFVFSTDTGDFAACQNIDPVSMEEIRSLVQRYFPTVLQPLGASYVGHESAKKRSVISRQVGQGMQYWMPQPVALVFKGVIAIAFIVYVAVGALSDASSSPVWERLWHALSQYANLLINAAVVLVTITASALKNRYIEVNHGVFVVGERPFGQRYEYQLSDIGDVLPAEPSLTTKNTPQSGLDVVILGVKTRLFDGLSRFEAVNLAAELRSAIGLRRGYGRVGS